MDSLVLALLMMHIEEYKKQIKLAVDDGDDTKVEVAYTAWKTLNGVLKSIQTQIAAIQQAQEDSRAENTQFNEGENPINKNEGGSNDED